MANVHNRDYRIVSTHIDIGSLNEMVDEESKSRALLTGENLAGILNTWNTRMLSRTLVTYQTGLLR